MLRAASATSAGQGGEENDAPEILRFGEFVSFFDNDTRGYLSGRLTSSAFASLCVRGNDNLVNPQLGNFQTAVFQIQAHNKYKANRKLNNAINKIKAKEPHLSDDQVFLEGGQELLQLKHLADAETADNELEQRRRNGDPVVYGQLLQLHHRHTNKYVKVSSTTTSSMEPSNMRVEMETLSSKNAWFRIMPRYKVRAEGDYVRTTDQVVLESAKTAGQFLHTSLAEMGEDRADCGSHEINLSVQQTSFMLRGHAAAHKKSDSDDVKFLRAGMVIQLFHKEISAWMAAEGIYQEATSTESGISEDVHLRIREPDPKRPSRLFPPTTAVTYWQVELHDQPTKGAIIAWEDRVRFRHLATQKYLAVSREGLGGLALKSLSEVDDRDTIFRMHAVIKEQPEIVLGTYTRIELFSDGFWMHAADDEAPVERQNNRINTGPDTELARKMRAIKWDGASLCAVTCTPDQLFDDAFIITEVPDDKVAEVSFVMGVVPICRLYIQHRVCREMSPLEAQRLCRALAELRDFLFVNGTRVKSRQKLIRNLGVVELLVQMLQAPFAPANQSASALALEQLGQPRCRLTRNVCVAAYGVLKAYLNGDSRKNELYVARHIPFFQTQVGAYIGVEKMYTELVRDNHKIVACMGDNEIDHFINLLRKDKNPDYLEFLSVLCECEDAPIVSNQNAVTEKLLGGASQSMVYLTEVNPANNKVEVNVSGRKDDWQPLEKFAASAMDEDDRTSTKEYLFLQYQLDLFGDLCLGRNDSSIEIITQKLKYLTWGECFTCARDVNLPKSLRAKYVALMVNLFVDIDDNVDILENIELTYTWSELSAKPNAEAMKERTMALSGARMDYFPELSQWLISFLNEYPQMVASDRATNKLLAEVLQLVTFLVKFGYFIAPDDIKGLMIPLGGIVNGMNDLPQDGKKVTFAQGKPVKSSKSVSNNYVQEWRNTTRYEQNANNEVVVEAKKNALEAINALFNFCFTVRMQLFLFDFKQVAEWTGDRKNTRQKGAASSGDTYKPTLGQMQALQAMSKCTSEDDCIDHCHNIRDYCAELFQRCNWVFPGWQPGRKWTGKGDNLIDVLLDLSQYNYSGLLIESLILLNRFYSAQWDLFKNVKQAMVLTVPDSIDLAARLRKNVPELRRLGAGLIEPEEARPFKDILAEFTRDCYLQEPNEPHSVNQHIIYNSGIVPTMLDICDSEGQSADVLSAVFQFLRAIARRHPQVQEELFDVLDNLLTIETDANGWQNDLAFCLSEIFTDNQEMCIGVKGSQVEDLMELLAQHNVAVPNLLVTLRAVAKVEELNVPLKRNQHLIMKYLMQYRQDIIDTAYIDDASNPAINAKRMNLLRHGDDPGSSDLMLLDYHVNLVSLLAACAEGENRFIESMCQTIFNLSELLEVLLDPEITTSKKGAYLRFFLWVYLNTAGSAIEIGTDQLHMDKRLWAAIKVMAENEIATYAISGVLSQEEKAFAFDAFIPFLTKVVKNYYRPGDTHVDDPESKKILRESTKVVKTIGNILSDFATRALPNLFARQDVKTLSACMMAIAAAHQDVVPTSVLNALGSKLTSGEAGILESELVARYNNKYQKQTELNQYLNAFALNVRAAYRGENTVAHQLSSSSPTSDVALRAYCEDEDDDETLPLGPEFQAHVNLFCNYKLVGGTRVMSINARNLTAIRRQLRASHTFGATLDAKSKEELDDLDVKSLQIVRALVHNQAKLDLDVNTVQNQVANTKVLLPIADMLHSEEDDVVREALACLAALLREGNDAAQNTFEEHFLGTREETFFDDVQTRMRRALESLREIRILQRQTAEEKQRQSQLMGTMTLAGAMGNQFQDALKEARRFDSVALAGPIAGEDSHTDMEMAPLSRKKEAGDDQLEIKDEGNIELVLRVLQLMCEGHNNVLQNYLRYQPDNIRSIDLVAETVSFLQALTEDIDVQSMPLMIQTIETLVELEQGCQENQGTIFDNRAIDYVNTILRYPGFTGCSDEEVAHLKLACGVLVLSMLEDSDEATQNMARELEEVLDIPAVFRTMDAYYKISKSGADREWETDPDEDDDPVPALNVAFTYFNIIKRLEDFTGVMYEEDAEFCPFVKPKEDGWGEDNAVVDPDAEQEAASGMASAVEKAKEKGEQAMEGIQKLLGNFDNSAFQELDKKTVSIEILREGRLQKIHFFDKYRVHLREEVKEDLLWNVDRSSPSDKIRDFVARCKVIMADIDYLKWVMSLSPVTQVLIKNTNVWNKLLLFLTFVLNIMILAAWDAPRNFTDPVPTVDFWYPGLLYVIGGAHVFVSFLVTSSYFLVNPPSVQGAIEALPFYSSIESCFPGDDSLRTKKSLFSVMSLYYLAVVVMSILGLIFHGYFFAFHLLHICINNDILLRVIQSVTKNGKSLLWVAALMIIVIYIYSLIGFAVYRQNFDEEEGAFCETSFQCFVTSLRLGLLSGGGLGEALPGPNFGFEASGIKTIFDLSFFIIITTIGLNVVFGIIVDTFSELRDEKYQIQEAMESECFISSLKNYDFERFGNGFQHHVKHEQNMWNYLFYMMHLKEKEPTEYTSNEQYVFEALATNQETSVFPINRAISLSNTEDNGVEDRLGRIEGTLEGIVNRLDAQENRLVEEQRRLQAQQLRQ